MIGEAHEAPLRRNRWARVALIEDDGRKVLTLACPVRERGLQLNRLSLAPQKLERLHRRLFGEAAVAVEQLEDHERDFLRGLGYLVTPAEEPPPVEFSCRLGEAAPAAVAGRARPPAAGDRLFAGPWVAGGQPDLYVLDERLGYEVPYWRGEPPAGDDTRAGGEAVAPLDVAALGRQLAQRGFVVIRGLLPRALTLAAQRYFAALAHHGYLHYEPQDVHHTLFDPPLGVALHQLVTPLARRIAGEALQPTYSFVTRYLAGAVLPPHTDTDWAELSLSVAIDHESPAGGGDVWPLCVIAGDDGAEARTLLQPGDALMFRGRDLTHYRQGALPAGQTTTAMLLHYVGADHVGPIGPAERSRRA